VLEVAVVRGPWSVVRGPWFEHHGSRVLTTESSTENRRKPPKIRDSGPRGGGAMASALFQINNPVKNDMG